MTFDEMCEFDVLYNAFLAARRGKRSKYSTAQYEANVLQLTERLSYILRTRKYVPRKFEVFYVREPKLRLVQAPAFVDKVVQHALVDNILYEAITHSFILDNYASQRNKGTHYGLTRLRSAMLSYFRSRKGKDEEYRRANGLPYKPMSEWDYADGWVLKCDVRKFFASIDHDLVKAKLRERVEDDRVFELMCTYIETSDGLPLGYQTSQLLALLFLDDFDHFVKERLRIRYFGRYMDDFYLIHEDKEYLRYCLKEIRSYLSNLRLELNEKTAIFPLRNGIDFCGFHTYLTETGKVVMKLRRSSIQRMNARLRYWSKAYPKGEVSKEDIIVSFQAWNAHAAHGNTYILRDRYRKRVENIIKEEIRI